MVFSSHWFLFAFLPACLASYFIAPRALKNPCLLFWSYLFYAWGAPKIVLLLLLSTVLDFYISKRLCDRRWFLAGVGLNLGVLAYFKYANFFVEELTALFGNPVMLEIALPIGISFFTFQKISYLADVYLKRTPPAESLIDYALYVALFPQLIAGPIIRYHDVSEQLFNREHTLDKVAYGIYRFCIGLGKKVLIADILGAVADNVFALPPANLGMETAWLGAICYSFQIYFDFSGYSDMAIGLGYIFGFKFLENFNRPYISRTITEFWRRWHISLSNWMREYLYIPLGGNRGSQLQTYRNLWVVFLLSGLWHGAAWTFVFWGAFHGLLLVLDRLFWKRIADSLSVLITIPLTYILVVISWVFFRSESLVGALVFLETMFDFSSFGQTLSPRFEIIDDRAIFTLAVASVLAFLPLDENSQGVRISGARMAVAVACLLLSTTALAAGNYSPFLYFRF